jgi:hypothetical protein
MFIVACCRVIATPSLREAIRRLEVLRTPRDVQEIELNALPRT